jgi:hypothetical protein
MRDYGKISTSLWNSRKFGSIKDPVAKLIYLYLHTCPHVNSVGCFVLRDGYAAEDIGITTIQYRMGIDTLSNANLIRIDRVENLIRIIGFLDHDPFNGPKHAKGAIRIAEKLPDCIEKLNLFKDMASRKYGPEVPKIDTLSIPYRMGIDSPEPEPEPEPEEKEKKESAIALLSDFPNQKKNEPKRFDEFWAAYPHRGGVKRGRKPALAKYAIAVRSGATEDDLIDAAHRYAGDRRVIDGYARDPTTWLNQAGWADDIEMPDMKAIGDNYDARPDSPSRTDQRRTRGPHDSLVSAFAFVAGNSSGD